MKHIVVLLKNSLLLICMSIIIFTACNSRKERIEKQIKIDQKIYSTKILDITMENVVKNINEKIKIVAKMKNKFSTFICLILFKISHHIIFLT